MVSSVLEMRSSVLDFCTRLDDVQILCGMGELSFLSDGPEFPHGWYSERLLHGRQYPVHGEGGVTFLEYLPGMPDVGGGE